MKDYSYGFNEKFILNYLINNEEKTITINYSNGSIIVPYSREKEEEILKQMKSQLEIYSWKEEILQRRARNLNLGIFDCSLGCLDLAMFCSKPNIASGLAAAFCGGVGLYFTSSSIKAKKLLNDYRKNQLFLENEDKINAMLRSIYMETMPTDTIKPVEENVISLNINDIDGYTYEEVKELVMKANK